MKALLYLSLAWGGLNTLVSCFSPCISSPASRCADDRIFPQSSRQKTPVRLDPLPLLSKRVECDEGGDYDVKFLDESKALDPLRRSVWTAVALGVLTSVTTAITTRSPSFAAVGSLPELADTNAILQGVTVAVADKSQLDSMVAFLQDGFGFTLLRQRIQGTVEEVWLGFGPEQLDIPTDFIVPVSSFAKYGGHASVHLVYDSQTSKPLYRIGDSSPPGDNVAYLQVGVPGYRISQIQKNGGEITDAYGHVDVISPAGLPFRGIVGFAPDPIMFVAINCVNVAASQAFYEQLGFIAQSEVSYARPSKGTTVFEPAPPPKSVYMAPTPNGMGVLLIPTKNKKKAIIANPVVQALNIVYEPASAIAGEETTGGRGGGEPVDAPPSLFDPSGVPIQFTPVRQFEAEERMTR